MNVNHTEIKVHTICKNGSERYGAKAVCEFTMNESIWIEVSQHGKTKKEAEEKLKNFMSSKGKYQLTEVTKP